LLWVLREDLHLTGTKFGCGIAMCGACTVLIEARLPVERGHMVPTRSCVTRAWDAQGRDIITIEGLASGTGSLAQTGRLVQQEWIDQDVPQCGYCQSGQIMTTVALIDAIRRKKATPTDDDIDAALAGNLCRCGTYQRIRAAVKAAAGKVLTGLGGKQ
jgi:aerobic-type carbon monoxide dehydrogenase small subunit (CoxS/CutS family)